MVNEFYEDMNTENLFGKGVKPEDLTDYHLAGALNTIALAGPQKVFSRLAIHAISYEKMPVKILRMIPLQFLYMVISKEKAILT